MVLLNEGIKGDEFIFANCSVVHAELLTMSDVSKSTSQVCWRSDQSCSLSFTNCEPALLTMPWMDWTCSKTNWSGASDFKFWKTKFKLNCRSHIVHRRIVNTLLMIRISCQTNPVDVQLWSEKTLTLETQIQTHLTVNYNLNENIKIQNKHLQNNCQNKIYNTIIYKQLIYSKFGKE